MCLDLIVEAFKILENVQRMGTRIISFKDIMAFDLQHDDNFSLNHATIVSLKVQSLTEETRKGHSLPTLPKITQIQVGWKRRVDILKSLTEKVTLPEDQKSAIFFKESNVVK